MAPGFRYETTTTDFTVADNSIAAQITSLIAGGANPSSIAVYLAAFDEVVGVFDLAGNYPALLNTVWYGSDGVALSAALLADPVAAAFAIHSRYPNPIFGLPDALRDRWQPVADAIQARTGITADAFALSAYDALFVVQNALVHANPRKNFGNFKAAFVNEADEFDGVTGSTALDAAGDREKGDFDFWAVRLQGATDTWTRTGTYNNGVITLF